MPRLLLPLLVTLLLAACDSTPASDRPHWRRPGPAATGPVERIILPDDGFYDSLA